MSIARSAVEFAAAGRPARFGLAMCPAAPCACARSGSRALYAGPRSFLQAFAKPVGDETVLLVRVVVEAVVAVVPDHQGLVGGGRQLVDPPGILEQEDLFGR